MPTISNVTVNKNQLCVGESITISLKLAVESSPWAQYVNGTVELLVSPDNRWSDTNGSFSLDTLGGTLQGISIFAGESKTLTFTFTFPSIASLIPYGSTDRLFSYGFNIRAYSGGSVSFIKGYRVAGSILTSRIAPTINSVEFSDGVSGLYSRFGGYVKGEGSPVVTISASPDPLDPTGAPISIYDLTFYEDAARTKKIFGIPGYGSNPVYSLPAFMFTGTLGWSLTVIPLRGPSATVAGTVVVREYTLPVINAFVVRRYESYVDDFGVTQYKDSDIGDHVRVSVTANISEVGGGNAFSMVVEYNIVGDSTILTAPIVSGDDGESVFIQLNRTFITDVIGLGSDYEFKLVLTDWFHTVESFDSVSKAEAVMHVGPYGVAFGGFSTASESDKKDEFMTPVYFSNEIFDGDDSIHDAGWTDLVFLNGENRTFPPDYHLQYKKIGKHVWIRGIITISFTGTSKAICDLPFPATGGKIIYAVGGGNNRVSLSIAYATQTLNISGVTSAAGASVTNFNSWVDCSIDYWTD